MPVRARRGPSLRLAAGSAAGFTLIELLVVLMLVVMTASLVAPRFWHLYEKSGERETLEKLAMRVLDERREAMRRDRAVELPPARAGAPEPPPLVLPEGWRILSFGGMRMLPTGVVSGGVMRLRSPSGRRWRLSWRPLDGRPSIEIGARD